jgi:peptidoglycan-N-acetylglucosamine deacetylase
MIRPPEILRKFFPSVTWRIPVRSKELYLTFDDGPVEEVTPLVLDILNQYQVKATFFCIGSNVQKHPEIYKRILEEGHTTGNHTQTHVNAWKVQRDVFIKDVKDAESVISSRLFRPPYGKLTPAIINRLKKEYQIVLWDVITYDFDPALSADEVFQNSITRLRPGSIIVFHDSIKAGKTMLAVLPRFLDYCQKKGFTFRAIPSR